jgi:sec-independent protein translocase protein TatC
VARLRRVRPDDELTLVEHLDELRSRLITTLVVLAIAVAVCFWQSGAILRFLSDPLPHHNGHPYKFLATSPLDPFLTSVSIGIYCSLLITLPVATYQLYAYVIPAFAEEYHRHIRPLVAMIPALFGLGVVFCWYLVIPPALSFLINYNSENFTVQLRAPDYIQFVVVTLAALGIVFELPVVMLILGRIGIVTSARMRRHWRISIVVLAVVAMLLPGVDPISFIVEFVPLLALYAFSYVLVRMVEPRRSGEQQAEPEPSG